MKLALAAAAVLALAACGAPSTTDTTAAPAPTVTVTASAVEESPSLPDTSGVEAAAEVSDHLDAYSTAVAAAGDEMGSGAPDTDAIRTHLADMKAETRALEALQDSVPPCAGEALGTAISSMKKINKGAELAVDSYDAFDIDGLTRATELVNQGSSGMEDASSELQACM